MNQIKKDVESLMFLKKAHELAGESNIRNKEEKKRGKDVGGSAGWKGWWLMILTEFSGEFLSHDSAKLQSEVTHFICLYLLGS